ncbi:UDP-N-acetylmuramate--L-alanine ligase [Thermaerobacter marianensis DSM 12885]|uniref:UDP-N-acetylmuramate--L-alanine ligase n=1 Tax=Thermaerobacter marianensis (strain ATCC 700841 / DSM 12885 / JCM 10246 / 7p75a) TaxID=644966 RepID=E6SMD6_THEM7|nr:UDP-N-acetylmuramate--L-alanine ligase [Thermaerobacter marianensis]ADU50396.1 UDP-N-acetylmuramate--L-alanine ligase [Thermaerobacter marianensis DSM 12885]
MEEPGYAPPVEWSGKRVHFIGIGGYGMSGLARVLLARGARVSGSDVRPSDRTRWLAEQGAAVHIGHAARHVAGADLVVYNTDVPADNVELVAAREAGIPVWHRSQVLADLLNHRRSVAVTGTHGKTTTTAMTGLVLVAGGLDPTVLVGGEVPEFGAATARLGEGPWVVAEACESDGTFLRYLPEIAVVTNVEPEHLDHYGGDFAQLLQAFARFLRNVRPGGLVVACGDHPVLRQLLADRTPAPGVRVVRYGMEAEDSDLRARDVQAGPEGTRFTVWQGGRPLGEVRLAVPGLHNVLNALAAVAVGLELRVPFAAAAAALASFHGAKRRFQVIYNRDGILVVDDYAHHPTEIRATLRAARQRQGEGGRVIAVFQPQRYSRTRLLMDEFARAFGDADRVILTEIYAPPGERPIPGVSSAVLADRIAREEGRPVELIASREELVEHLLRTVRPGDLVLTMGAGDIWTVARDLARRLQAVTPA